MDESTPQALDSKLTNIASWILIVFAFVMPLFIIPWAIISFEFSKTFLLAAVVIVTACIWLYGVLKEGRIVIPKSMVLGSLFLIPLVTFISALLSDNVFQSLIGQGFETTTFAFITVMVLLTALTASICDDKSRAFSIYLAFFLVLVVLGLYHLLRLIIGVDFLSFGIANSMVDSIVGSWYDLGAFFAVGLLLSLIALETLTLTKGFRVIFYLLILASVIALAIINSVTVWLFIGILSLLLFIYLLSFKRGDQSDVELSTPRAHARGQTSKLSIVLFFISLAFVLFGGTFGDVISSRLNTTYIQVAPSWGSTYDIAVDSLKDHPVLGSGPNTFVGEWIQYKPLSVNTSRFWNTDFTFGVGYIPTVLATTGILGILVWLFFFITFIYAGFKAVLRKTQDSFSYYLMVSSFFASLFLWLYAIFAIPGVALISLTMIMTGVFIASLVAEGMVARQTFDFTQNPRAGFFATSITIVTFIVLLALAYGFTTRFVSFTTFQAGLQALNTDIARAETLITRAAGIHNNAVYQRALSEVHIVQINELLQESDLSDETTVAEFQTLFSDALNSARNATEINRFDYQNWMAYGRVYGAVTPLGVEGAYEAAQEQYRRAQTFNPKSPAIELTLAQLEIANQDNEAARGFIAQALQKKPNYTNAIFLLSQIEASEGNTAQAIRSAEQAALIAPNDPTVFFQVGILKYNNNDFEGAVESLTRAVALNSNYANARYFLGLASYETGDTDTAIAQFEVLEENNPENEEIVSILANLVAGLAPLAENTTETLDELPIDESVE